MKGAQVARAPSPWRMRPSEDDLPRFCRRFRGAILRDAGEPMLRALYFDNYHIRVLLGREAARLPWGAVGAAHLAAAKSRLAAFDLVLPLEALSGALPALRRAAGPRFDLGGPERFGWGRRSNTRAWRARASEVPELATLRRLFLARNRWDAELYAWARARSGDAPARQSHCARARVAGGSLGSALWRRPCGSLGAAGRQWTRRCPLARCHLPLRPDRLWAWASAAWLCAEADAAVASAADGSGDHFGSACLRRLGTPPC